MKGTKLSVLSQKLHMPGELGALLNCTAEELAVFRFMQKSVDTPLRIKSLSNMVNYIKKYRYIEIFNLSIL